MDLESVRDSLIRQEDTIVFSLIERAKFPINSWAYSPPRNVVDAFSASSFVHSFVRASEALHAKAGRYENPEENPFFPDDLPPSMVPTHDYKQVLHLAGSSINVNKTIWDIYLNKLLPLFAAEGDDGNYGLTAACDLACLQAISRRIHYGKFVAEVKFKESPEEYGPAIRAQDRAGLMKMLTFERVEEMVKKRVEKKAMVFGQEVSLSDNSKSKETYEVDLSVVSWLYEEWVMPLTKEVQAMVFGQEVSPSDNSKSKETYKVDPSVVSRLYEEWVMPLTKEVQVEYLLRRLD